MKDKLLTVLLLPLIFVLWVPFFIYSCIRHGNIRLKRCDGNCEICYPRGEHWHG